MVNCGAVEKIEYILLLISRIHMIVELLIVSNCEV